MLPLLRPLPNFKSLTLTNVRRNGEVKLDQIQVNIHVCACADSGSANRLTSGRLPSALKFWLDSAEMVISLLRYCAGARAHTPMANGLMAGKPAKSETLILSPPDSSPGSESDTGEQTTHHPGPRCIHR